MADSVAKDVGNWLSGAGESLRNTWSKFADGVSDLRPYDVVVKLGEDKKNPGSSLVYVGNDSNGQIKGDIKRIDTATLNEIKPGTVNFVDLKALSPKGSLQFGEAAVRMGANEVVKNYGTLLSSGGSVPGLDPEHPERVTTAMLPSIRDALQNIRADLINQASPDFKLGEDGRIDSTKYRDSPELIRKINEVERAYKTVQQAIDLPAYRNDLSNDVDTGKLTQDQRQNILNVLDVEKVDRINVPGGTTPAVRT